VGNMKALVLVVVASLVSVGAVAEEKIAVVDIARAIFGSNAAQESLRQAEQGADFVSLKAKYEGSAADLQSLAKEAESKRLTWSQEQAGICQGRCRAGGSQDSSRAKAAATENYAGSGPYSSAGSAGSG
jgi:Skp family chaperone for outer membrane proteins